jgi:DNA-binding response OmpR family regulator
MKRVLVVEDDPDILDSLTLLLEASYAVTPAEDGGIALEFVDQQEFDAVVLDLMMPVLDGTQFLEQLRQRGIQVPVILISAHRDLDEKHRQLGAFAALRKPFDILELEKRLEEALDPGGTGGPREGPGGTGNTVLQSPPDKKTVQGSSVSGWPFSTHRWVLSSPGMIARLRSDIAPGPSHLRLSWAHVPQGRRDA